MIKSKNPRLRSMMFALAAALVVLAATAATSYAGTEYNARNCTSSGAIDGTYAYAPCSTTVVGTPGGTTTYCRFGTQATESWYASHRTTVLFWSGNSVYQSAAGSFTSSRFAYSPWLSTGGGVSASCAAFINTTSSASWSWRDIQFLGTY